LEGAAFEALDAQAAVRQSHFVYRIIGADGKEYGPISGEQLGKWVAEGRANAETRTVAEGSTEWKPGAAPAVLTSPAPARRTNGFAVASLAMGIFSVTVGLCCYGIPFNILGVVFAVIALSQIKQSPALYDGKGAAIAGLVLSVFSLVVAAILIVVLGLHATWGEFRHHVHRL
jgi:hypothetical protein